MHKNSENYKNVFVMIRSRVFFVCVVGMDVSACCKDYQKAYLQKIKQWKNDGWRVELFYLYLPNAEFSARRVEYRVKQGGHNIPSDAIERRYPRSVANLFEYADVCDVTHCVDNSQREISLIFDVDANGVNIYNDTIYKQMKEFCHDC